MPDWKGKPRKLSKDLVYKLRNAPFKVLLYEMNQFIHLCDLRFVGTPLGAGQAICLIWEIQKLVVFMAGCNSSIDHCPEEFYTQKSKYCAFQKG